MLSTLLASDASHTMLQTMVVALSAGVLLIVIARRLDIPGIVLLLAGGFLLGPQVWGEHALVQPDSLGDGLQVIVSLCVGLILFEGGLTLNLDGYRSAPGMIKRMLTVGVAVTWITTAAVLHLVLGLEAKYAILSASVVIVTGPTVIAPLLKRVKIEPRLHSILHWEGVLIDPIGVFIALLCFELVVGGQSGSAAVINLLERVGAGLGVGGVGGFIVTWIVRRKLVPEDMVNVFAIASAVLIFGIAEAIETEAGLLSATVAGFVLGLSGAAKVKQIREFKAELTDLLIGTLFILLSSRLELGQFKAFAAEGGIIAVAIVVLLVRPVAIAICAVRTDLSKRERLFLGWVGPKGIVAASMASLFAIRIAEAGSVANPRLIETFTYSVIIATIVLQTPTAGVVARLLNLERPVPTGWMIVGSHSLGWSLAGFIRKVGGHHVVLLDNNARAVQAARSQGHVALLGDARDTSLTERVELQGVGNLLALTDNEDLNIRVCERWSEVLGNDHVFRVDQARPGSIDVEDQMEETAGHPVWLGLPKPTLLAAELERGEALMIEAGGHEEAYATTASPIVTVRDGAVTLGAPQGEVETPTDDDAGPEHVLYLRRQADYLMRSVRAELIGPLEAADLDGVVATLVDRIVATRPSIRRDEMVREILDRERSFPTLLGHGVATPHAFTSAVKSRVCAIGQIPGGIDLGAPDGAPVRLVFLLLSPEGDPEGHLATLADIGRLVVVPAVRERLMAASSPLEVIRMIRASSVR